MLLRVRLKEAKAQIQISVNNSMNLISQLIPFL